MPGTPGGHDGGAPVTRRRGDPSARALARTRFAPLGVLGVALAEALDHID